MTGINTELLIALQKLIPFAEHPEHWEGDCQEIRDARALVARAHVAEAWERERGWLVERGGNGTPMYRTLEHGVPVWTTDNLKALRFARREDAELFAAEDEDAWMVTEHSWEGPKSPPSADGNG